VKNASINPMCVVGSALRAQLDACWGLDTLSPNWTSP